MRGILQLEAVLDDLFVRGGKEAIMADARKKMAILEPILSLRTKHVERQPVANKQLFPASVDQAGHIIHIPNIRTVVSALLGVPKGKYAEGMGNKRIYVSPHVSEQVYESVVEQLTTT